jgi:magnesium chelatase family protein
MDRIDLQVIVSRLKPEEITNFSEGEPSASVRSRVQQARIIQQQRYKNELNINCNAQMQSRQIRTWCQLDTACKNLIEAAIRKLGLSARASDRILKVARTIADLEKSELLTTAHVAEAIQYRTLDRVT